MTIHVCICPIMTSFSQKEKVLSLLRWITGFSAAFIRLTRFNNNLIIASLLTSYLYTRNLKSFVMFRMFRDWMPHTLESYLKVVLELIGKRRRSMTERSKNFPLAYVGGLDLLNIVKPIKPNWILKVLKWTQPYVISILIMSTEPILIVYQLSARSKMQLA